MIFGKIVFKSVNSSYNNSNFISSRIFKSIYYFLKHLVKISMSLAVKIMHELVLTSVLITTEP